MWDIIKNRFVSEYKKFLYVKSEIICSYTSDWHQKWQKRWFLVLEELKISLKLKKTNCDRYWISIPFFINGNLLTFGEKWNLFPKLKFVKFFSIGKSSKKIWFQIWNLVNCFSKKKFLTSILSHILVSWKNIKRIK